MATPKISSGKNISMNLGDSAKMSVNVSANLNTFDTDKLAKSQAASQIAQVMNQIGKDSIDPSSAHEAIPSNWEIKSNLNTNTITATNHVTGKVLKDITVKEFSNLFKQTVKQ